MKYHKTLTNTLLLANLKSYLTLANDSLELFKKQNDDFIKRMSENQNIDNWEEEGSHLNNIDWLFLNSIYVTMYSSFEHFLYKVTQMLESQPNTKICLKHIAGRGILEQYSNYILLIGGIEAADKGKSPWDKIAQHQAIRNMLVHNGGIMMENLDKPLEKHKNYSFLKTQHVLMVGNLGMIRICELKILKSFVTDVTLITNNIVKEYNNRYNTLLNS